MDRASQFAGVSALRRSSGGRLAELLKVYDDAMLESRRHAGEGS